MMLALPGGAYVYQGEELGLPEAVDIPDDRRDNPTFFRTNGESYGRDGCRVPIPWEDDKPSFGFGSSNDTWLPQPAVYREYARNRQEGLAGSTLELYKRALKLRREFGLGTGSFQWIEGTPNDVLAFTNGVISVYCNYSDDDFALPAGEIILDSDVSMEGTLAPAATVWMR
jgi:alpha-glucosidase